MSYRILATTDLSANSKPGLRFAIQLASQIGAEIVFYFIIDTPGPTSWSDENYQHFEKEKTLEKEEQLKKFVGKIYKQMGISPGPGEYVVKPGAAVDKLIVSYAQENNIDLICMSTRGGGLIRRLLGTHTSAVLSSSPVPVVAIPKSYRRKPLSRILYATDFKDLDYELDALKKIATPLNASILVYHYYIQFMEEYGEVFRQFADRHTTPNIHFKLKQQNLEDTLVENIKKDASRVNASMIAMFNLQTRDWVEQIFDTSKSADLTFGSNLPVLVLRKRAAGE